MSADSKGLPEQPLPRAVVIRTNRRQAMFYVALTLLLTVATVWAGRSWLRTSETLTFAVGAPNSEQAQFAENLAGVLEANASRLRLQIAYSADNAKALARFDRREADLAVLRTDGKIPLRARAIAILDHDIVLLLGPGTKKIKSLAELKKRKIAILAEGDGNAVAWVRKMLDIGDSADAAARIQMAPQGATLERLFGQGGFGAVIVLSHASSVMKDKSYEQLAKRGGFTLNAIDESKALVRKLPGVSEETIATGLLSSSPDVPDDDLGTIGLQWLLVTQAGMSTTTAGDLARAIYENKAALALGDGFASHIEPAATEKDAFVIAHQGAAEYINDDTKSFMDRYSDMMYLGAGALSIIGSIFATIYANFTRVAPERASELATAILVVGEKVEHAASLDSLEALHDELETILRGAVIGLHDGTISCDGLETFKLGYELVRDEIAMRRDNLKRHARERETGCAPVPADDDAITVIKSARSG